MQTDNKEIVLRFIEVIWNQRRLDELSNFISEEYVDHSFVAGFPNDRDGLAKWIDNTSKAFDHRTVVETIVAEGEYVVARISFHVTHIGPWRGIDPHGATATVKGFRLFKLQQGLIISQWGLIDGEALQSALSKTHHGCELPK